MPGFFFAALFAFFTRCQCSSLFLSPVKRLEKMPKEISDPAFFMVDQKNF